MRLSDTIAFHRNAHPPTAIISSRMGVPGHFIGALKLQNFPGKSNSLACKTRIILESTSSRSVNKALRKIIPVYWKRILKADAKLHISTQSTRNLNEQSWKAERALENEKMKNFLLRLQQLAVKSSRIHGKKTRTWKSFVLHFQLRKKRKSFEASLKQKQL